MSAVLHSMEPVDVPFLILRNAAHLNWMGQEIPNFVEFSDVLEIRFINWHRRMVVRIRAKLGHQPMVRLTRRFVRATDHLPNV